MLGYPVIQTFELILNTMNIITNTYNNVITSTFDFANPFPLSSGEEGLLATPQCALLENTN